MSAVTAWILSILGIVVVGTVIDLILPSGRMNKYIRSIFAAVTILIIVLPIPNLIKNGFKFDGGFIFDSEVKLDDGYLRYSNRIKLRYLEKGLLEALGQDGVTGVTAQIDGDVSGNEIKITRVTVNLSNLVIDEKYEHINKYELIEGLVTKYLNVDKGYVVLNE